MHLIMIGGLPASGKSKLAERLRSELRWPLLSKDAYKETLFDALGVGDREWSRRLSRAAYALLFAEANRLLDSGQSCIVEGNFRWHEHRVRFEELSVRGMRLIQVMCRADPNVLAQRFRLRAHSGQRHPGHVDLESLDEIERELLTAVQDALPLNAPVVVCDTTEDWQAAIARTCADLVAQVRSV
jgi:predicted kinase